VVRAGKYQNASEAIRDALSVLQQRRREDALKLRALRIHVKAGVDALKRGDFTEVGGNDLDQYLENKKRKQKNLSHSPTVEERTPK
jgi:antitoxin ParD1/3/4